MGDPGGAGVGVGSPAPVGPAGNPDPSQRRGAQAGNAASSPGGGPQTGTAAPRDRASPTAKKRGDGLERRSPTGIARERETCTNDAGCQRESRTTSCRRGERTDPIMWVPAAQPPALHTRTAFQHRRETRAANGSKSLERRSPTGIARERETCTNDAGCQRSKSAGTAWNADLWPVLPVGAGTAGLWPAKRGMLLPWMTHSPLGLPSDPVRGRTQARVIRSSDGHKLRRSDPANAWCSGDPTRLMRGVRAIRPG